MPDETKIVGKIEEQRGTTYITEQGTYIKETPKSMSVYSNDPKEPHDSIHFNKNNDGTFTVTEKHGEEKPESSSCYLTTACLKHLAEHFRDDCYELTTLRWFRDNFVNPSDISIYYEIAPLVVEQINVLPEEEQNMIYEKIYSNVISPCVKFIEQKKYDSAYRKYKESVLELKTKFLPSFV